MSDVAADASAVRTAGPDAGARRVGIVVIGRNLGERLDRCLNSVGGLGVPVVYVDSASVDGSAERARARGARAMELDPSEPLSASRGRNAGVRELLLSDGGIDLVQFVDGDCELDPGWLNAGLSAVRADPGLGIVCGRVREKHADRSVVARMLDIDWSGPVGEINACGGIFLCRVEAFTRAGGFATDLATGEEADLCARVRGAGFGVRRIDAPMCAHDADMHTLAQWLRRSVRVGYTYAMVGARAAGAQSPGAGRRIASVMAWGVLAPSILAATLLGGVWWRPLWGIGGVILALHGLFLARVALRKRRDGLPTRDAAWYALFTLLGKYAHAAGCIGYWAARHR